MKNPKFPDLGSACALGCLLIASASADPVVPAAWKHSNAFSSQRLPANLSNANGMDPGETVLYNLNGSIAGEPVSANGVAWLASSKPGVAGVNTAAAAGRIWIVADLGGRYDLATIRIWNFQWQNNPTSDLSNRGVSQFDLLVRDSAADTDDGTTGGTAINTSNAAFDDTVADDAVFNPGTGNPWIPKLENQALAKAPNDDAYSGEVFNFPAGTTARFVAIQVDSYYGGGGLGLGKVRFTGTLVADNDPPTLLSIQDNSNGDPILIPNKVTYTVTFSETMDAGSVGIDDFGSAGSAVAAIDSVSGIANGAFSVVVAPTTPGTLQLRINQGAVLKDPAGNPLNTSSALLDDTTVTVALDDIAPALTRTIPADDAAQVPTVATTPLTLVFDEPVVAGSGNLTIRKVSDNSMVETIDVSSAAINGSAVAVSRTVDLNPATNYYVTVDPGAFKDAANNPIAGVAGPAAWSFTTWAETPLVAHYFSGNGGDLSASPADVFGIPTGGSVTGSWVAATHFKTNGEIGVVAGQGAAYLDIGTFIDAAKGEPDGKFRLTLTVSETVGGWVSFGFTRETAPATTRNFTNTGTGGATNGVATIIRRSITASPAHELDAFRLNDAATGQTNLDGPDGLTGERTLTIDLDFTPAGGYDGIANFGSLRFFDSETGQFQQHTYTTDRSFGAIFISEVDGSGGTIRGLTLSQLNPTGNTAPTLSDITDQSIPGDTSTSALPFTIVDNETPAAGLAVHGGSDNPALVPNAGLVFGGSGANRTLTITPTAGQTGTATITVIVDDGNKIATDSFVLTVTAATTGDFATWATANGIGGEPFEGDFEKDGISNGMEYALGLNPTTSSQPPGMLENNTITFIKGSDAVTNGDVIWAIEISETLGAWTTAVAGVTETATSIRYVFTPGTPAKNFARLKVTRIP